MGQDKTANILGVAVEGQEGAIVLGLQRLGLPASASDSFGVKGALRESRATVLGFVEKGLLSRAHRVWSPICFSASRFSTGSRAIAIGMRIINQSKKEGVSHAHACRQLIRRESPHSQ